VSLQSDSRAEIILQRNQFSDNCDVGDEINVFIYPDSRGQLTGTTRRVNTQVGEVAYLKVIDTNKVGAFLDWGIEKDLLVPFNQQQITMSVGKYYLVYVYLDEETGRILASSKLNRFIAPTGNNITTGQAVNLIISDKTDIGYSAVINNQLWGVLYFSDVVKPPKYGQRLKGYIKNIRDDGKINLSLQAIGYAKVEPLTIKILKQLEQNDGFIALSDKSPPELIYERFGVSKKSFKMTIGKLYKQKHIIISKEGIRLANR